MALVNSKGRRLPGALACLLLSALVAWLAFDTMGAAAKLHAAKRRADAHSRRAVKRPSAVSSAPRGAKGLRRSAAAGEPLLEGVSEEDPEGRASWFYFKRAYPSGTIPADARRPARESRPGVGKGRARAAARQ